MHAPRKVAIAYPTSKRHLAFSILIIVKSYFKHLTNTDTHSKMDS